MPLRVRPTRPRRQSMVALRDIGQGANLKSSPFNIPLNQMKKLENAYLVEDGSIMGRRGTDQWNAVTLGSGEVRGGIRAYFAGDNHFLAAHAGTIYRGNDGPKTFTSTLTGWDATSPVWFWQYLNFVYAANKIDAPQKWNGTAWSAMGIAAPTAAPTAAVGAAGTPNGTYTIKYTFLTATIESNGSPASGSVTVTNQQINVSGIAVGPTGTTKRKIYGFKNGVSSVYQLIGEINNNVDTTFTVTTDQPSWTTTIPSTNNPPVTGAWLTVGFKNRGWKAGDPANPRRLYFSQILVPEGWPTTFFVDIPFDQGDEITALFVLGDLLLVFGHTAVFYVVGDTPFSFIIKRSFATAGCPSPWAIDRVENAAIYLSRHAFYAFDGAQSRIISDPIEPQFTDLFQSIAALNYAQADRVTLKYHDRIKAIVCSFPTGGSAANDTTWWYFLRRHGWAKDTRAGRLLISRSGKDDDGGLFMFDASDGILREWDPIGIYDDDGAAITLRMETGVLSGEHPLATKMYGWLTVRAKPANATAQITATLDQGQETDTFTMSLLRGAVYGTGQYGTATYGAEIDDFEERFLANMRGRGLELEIAIPYTEQIRVAQLFVSYDLLPSIRRRTP